MQPEIPNDRAIFSSDAAQPADPLEQAINTEPEAVFSTEPEIELTIPDINKELVLPVFEGLSTCAEEYQRLYQLYEQTPSGAIFNALQNTLLEAFPSVLSAQIRDLFTPEACLYGRLRLREINEAYLTLARMLSALALSNLWAAALERKDRATDSELIIKGEDREVLCQFLEMPPEVAADFDYIQVAITVGRILQDNQIKPYIEELVPLTVELQQPGAYYAAYHFLETRIRPQLKGNAIAAEEVEALCLQANRHLGKLLQACAFFCAYQLVTVKEVSVYGSPSATEPMARHSIAAIKGGHFTGLNRVAVQNQRFTGNNSIFISRNDQVEGSPLDLSPFLIDENACRIKKNYLPKVYFYQGSNGENLHYQHAEILSYQFELAPEYDRRKYRDLDIIFQQLAFFRQTIGV